MRAKGVGDLCFIKGTVNAKAYQDTLEDNLLPVLDNQFYREAIDIIFQHDLTPEHSANITSSSLRERSIPVLKWPANSPDLNVIEALWDQMKRKLRKEKPTTLAAMKIAIQNTWDSMSTHDCEKLFDSMPRQIDAVIKAKGAASKY